MGLVATESLEAVGREGGWREENGLDMAEGQDLLLLLFFLVFSCVHD